MVVILNTLYKNFDTIIASLLKTKNKTINEIQNILQTKKAKNISKHVTGGTKELAIAFRDNKKKPASYDECYNCYKLRQFGKYCLHPNKRF